MPTDERFQRMLQSGLLQHTHSLPIGDGSRDAGDAPYIVTHDRVSWPMFVGQTCADTGPLRAVLFALNWDRAGASTIRTCSVPISRSTSSATVWYAVIYVRDERLPRQFHFQSYIQSGLPHREFAERDGFLAEFVADNGKGATFCVIRYAFSS